jgi:hypothetical protein
MKQYILSFIKSINQSWWLITDKKRIFFLLSYNLLGMISEDEKSYTKDYGVNILIIMEYLYE